MAKKRLPAKTTIEKRRQREQVLRQAAKEGKVGAGASAAEPYEHIVDKAVKQVSGKHPTQTGGKATKQSGSGSMGQGSRQRRKTRTNRGGGD